MSQNGEMGSVFTTQEQMGKIPPQSPEKFSIFLVLFTFFHLFLPKICHAYPHKKFIFEINKDRFISSKVWSLEIENCSLIKHLKLDVFWLNFLNNWQKYTW